MIIFEFLLLSISTWVVFKTADYLFEKAKNFEYKIFFEKQKKTTIPLQNYFGFFGSFPVIFFVNTKFVPAIISMHAKEPIPSQLIIYWITIFHFSCLIFYCGVVQQCFKNHPLNLKLFWIKFSLSFLWSCFSILFCFTAGFIFVPVLIIGTIKEIVINSGFKVNVTFSQPS